MEFLNKNWGSLLAIIFLLCLAGLYFFGNFHFNTSAWTVGNWMTPVMIGLAALVDSVNPCAFSVLFLTMAFLFSLGHDRKFVLKAGFTYIFGIFLVYFLIGVGLLQVLSFFNIPHGLSRVGALIIILVGVLEVLDAFIPNFPIQLKIPNFAHKYLAPVIQKGTIPAALLLGVLVGMFEFPCTGGPYLFVLGILHDASYHIWGWLYLLVYNLIFVSPLFVILYLAARPKVYDAVDKLRRSKTKSAHIWLALAMILLGILILAL
jgi:cytochrome c biogenesis protein CcdA